MPSEGSSSISRPETQVDVIIITSSYPLNPDDSAAAAGVFVRDFAAEVTEQGHTVRVLTQDRPGYRADDPAFRVARYPWRGRKPLSTLRPTRPSDLLSLLSVIKNGSSALDDLIAEARPDLLIAMWAVPAGLLAMRAGRSRGLPYRVWALGSDIWGYGRSPLTSWIVRSVLRHSERNFADGIRLAEEVTRLAGRSADFLPSSRKLPIGQPAPPNVDPTKKNFAFVGRFHRNKGVDLLVEAIGLLDARQLGGMHFYLFGSGPMEARIRARVQELDLEASTSLMGYATAETVAAYLEHCHAVVIPSRVESIPVILSDAAQSRCPALVTDVGDMGTIVRRFEAGLVMSPTTRSIRDGLVRMRSADRAIFSDAIARMAQDFSLGTSAGIMMEGLAT